MDENGIELCDCCSAESYDVDNSKLKVIGVDIL